MELILLGLVVWWLGSTMQSVTRAIDKWVEYYVSKEGDRLSREDEG